MKDTDFSALSKEQKGEYMSAEGVQVLEIIHGYKVWLKPLRNSSNLPIVVNKGLFYHLEDIMDELDTIYKALNFKIRFDKSGSKITLNIEREKTADPWIFPYFEGHLAQKLGLPQLGTTEMLTMLESDVNFDRRASYLLTPSNVVFNRTRNIGLYVDFMTANFPGLATDEIVRLPGRSSGRFTDTNIIDFKHPVKLPIRLAVESDNKLSLVHVQFKDQDGNILNFPLGHNMIVLEFIKNENKTN